MVERLFSCGQVACAKLFHASESFGDKGAIVRGTDGREMGFKHVANA